MALLVGDVFRRAAAATPRRVAVSMGDRRLTFADVWRMAKGLEGAIRSLGVRRSDRIAWLGTTVPEAVPMFAALAELGAVFVPLNPGLGTQELSAVVDRARPSLLICGPQHLDEADALASERGDLARACMTDDGTLHDLGRTAVTAELAHRQAEGGAAGTAPRATGPGGVDETDPHVIFFTSGSTGAPKGVVLSHRANCIRTAPPNGPVRRGGTVCTFPLFHMASWTIGLGCWQTREELVMAERPDAGPILEAIQSRQAGRVYLIPAVWDRVLSELSGKRRSWDLSSLHEADTGTSATPPELLEAIASVLPHARTRVMYGSTECGAAASLAPEDIESKPGSVGLPAYGSEIRLEPDGEVCVRNDYLMEGYFEDEASTASALRGGWYHTGDLGALDDEGYLYIVGRARDIIRTGGETVAPAEVESVVAALPGVAEVAVVGVPDQSWGEVVCAVVVPEAGSHLDLAGLRKGCAGRLASFKQPRRLELVDSLPRTAATAQVQRNLIIERLGLRSR